MARIVFVSFGLRGVDGVSAEAAKWASILEGWGYEVHNVAGRIPAPAAHDHIIPLLNHHDPEIEEFTAAAFGSPDANDGSLDLHATFRRLEEQIRESLNPTLDALEPELVIIENVFSLPLNMPLSYVLARYLKRRNLPAVSVHHNSHWHDPAYRRCRMPDLLEICFPPQISGLRHVTTSREGHEELYRKSGITSTCIHNCFDFDAGGCDVFGRGLRSRLGIGDEEMFFLQPTPACQGRGAGHAIAFLTGFAEQSGRPARLVITGPCPEQFIPHFVQLSKEAAEGAGDAAVVHIPGWLGSSRDHPDALSPYALADAFACCDMVTFPSVREGFGNPVLESVAHRKPLIAANYPVLGELRSYGFQFLPFDRQAVARTVSLLEHENLMREMVERNFEIGRRHFSLEVLAEQLEELISSIAGSRRISGARPAFLRPSGNPVHAEPDGV